MYCKNCGGKIDDDSKFCKFCGKRQTPKKIVVEINEPSLPSQDSIRNAIFSTGRFLKKALLALIPLVIKLIICCIIVVATYYSTYYSYYFLNNPPEASESEIQLYREKGVTKTLQERYAAPYGDKTKISVFVYDYVNPSDILPNCKWDLDDELMDYPGCFNEKITNINETRSKFLENRSDCIAKDISFYVGVFCLLYFVIYFLHKIIVLFKRFKNWLYKKEVTS